MTLKYICKRIVLMLFTLFIIVSICFMLIRLLPQEMPTDPDQQAIIEARWDALGYNEPLLVQYGIYLKNIFTNWDFGTSWYISFRTPAWDLLIDRLLPTVMVNLYSQFLAVPVGILLGIYAAIHKNRWQDNVISTLVMLFVSIPNYIYAFIVQYILYFRLHLFPITVYSLADAGGSWFTGAMFYSMVPAILALSFGEIASLCRFTRAELTESLTSDYMLLARAKGLTNAQATSRHALKNAMVPILPNIVSSFIRVMAGSMIIEQIFAIPGIGQLFIRSINTLDYDVFMLDAIFYTFINLLAGLCVDITYGLIDPRIRMGEK